MTDSQERRSLPMKKSEWKNLEDLSDHFQTNAPRGISTGSPSWRSLIKAIAKGDLIVCQKYEMEEIEVE